LKSFYNEKKQQFDISKVPDIYDSAKYDAIHNSHLQLSSLPVRVQQHVDAPECCVHICFASMYQHVHGGGLYRDGARQITDTGMYADLFPTTHHHECVHTSVAAATLHSDMLMLCPLHACPYPSVLEPLPLQPF
jgi:hypothetical protein